jgi:hypothetical protein
MILSILSGNHDLRFAPILQQKEANKKCRRSPKALKDGISRK